MIVDRDTIAALADPAALGTVLTACGHTDDDAVEIHAVGQAGYTIRPATPGFRVAELSGLQFRDPGPRGEDDVAAAAHGILQSQAVLQADGYTYPTVILNLANDHDGRIAALERYGTVVSTGASQSPPVAGPEGCWLKLIADIGDDRQARDFLIHLLPNGDLLEQGLFRDQNSPKMWRGRWHRISTTSAETMVLTIDKWICTVDRVTDDLYRGVEVGPVSRNGKETGEIGVIHYVFVVRVNVAGIENAAAAGTLPATLLGPTPRHTESVLETARLSLSNVGPSSAPASVPAARRGFTAEDAAARRPGPVGHSVTICAETSIAEVRRAVHRAITQDIRRDEREYLDAFLTYYTMEPLDVSRAQTDHHLAVRPTAAVKLTWRRRAIDVVIQEQGPLTYAWMCCTQCGVDEPSPVRHSILGFKDVLALASRTEEILRGTRITLRPSTIRRQEPR